MQHLQKTWGGAVLLLLTRTPFEKSSLFICLNFCEELNSACEVLLKSILTVAILIAGSLLGFAFHSAIPSGAFAADDQSAVLVGAGDIADCKDLTGAEATAKLLDQLAVTVMAVGDLAYPDGSKENFVCYDKTWGRVKSRTRPAVGNHEFHSAGGTPYFDYFGAAAGDPKTRYYSYELGAWHIILLNSEFKDVRGREPGSPHGQWSRSDLSSHPCPCT